MPMPDDMQQVIAHFLTEFPSRQKRCKTEDYIRQYLSRRLKSEYVDDLMRKYLDSVISLLIDEHDTRKKDQELLRYRFIDTEGALIEGIGPEWQKKFRNFQDALNDLTDSEFELLSARILKILGCNEVWVTPQSHDQGLDSFGYSAAFKSVIPPEIHSQCRIVYLAQAKHYKKNLIGSRDIRELIGSAELAMFRIFSTVDEKYEDLNIKPYGPCILVLITTEEIPRTVKLIGRNAGIVVLSAQDLAILLTRAKIVTRTGSQRKSITASLKRSLRGIRIAH